MYEDERIEKELLQKEVDAEEMRSVMGGYSAEECGVLAKEFRGSCPSNEGWYEEACINSVDGLCDRADACNFTDNKYHKNMIAYSWRMCEGLDYEGCWFSNTELRSLGPKS